MGGGAIMKWTVCVRARVHEHVSACVYLYVCRCVLRLTSIFRVSICLSVFCVKCYFDLD